MLSRDKREAKVNTFDDLFGDHQAIIDDLYSWLEKEVNRDALFMLDGVLSGFRGIIHQRTREMSSRPKQGYSGR